MGANLGQAEGGLMAVKERSVEELQPKKSTQRRQGRKFMAAKERKETQKRAGNFCQRQGRDADFTFMGGEPSFDWVVWPEVVTHDIGVCEEFQNRHGGTFSLFEGSNENPSFASASRWSERFRAARVA